MRREEGSLLGGRYRDSSCPSFLATATIRAAADLRPSSLAAALPSTRPSPILARSLLLPSCSALRVASAPSDLAVSPRASFTASMYLAFPYVDAISTIRVAYQPA